MILQLANSPKTPRFIPFKCNILPIGTLNLSFLLFQRFKDFFRVAMNGKSSFSLAPRALNSMRKFYCATEFSSKVGKQSMSSHNRKAGLVQ